MINAQMTNEEKENTKLTGILGREMEIAHYQQNIDNYAENLKTLPADDWPDEIVKFKTLRAAEDIANKVPPELVSLVAEYALRDHIKFLKTTEELEQRKSKLFYEGAVAAIKLADGLDDAALNVKLAARKVEFDAEIAAQKL